MNTKEYRADWVGAIVAFLMVATFPGMHSEVVFYLGCFMFGFSMAGLWQRRTSPQ